MIAEGGRMRSLAGQSFVYGLGGMVGRFAGFFLLPIYVHAAGAKAYGTVDLMLSALTLSAVLRRMGTAIVYLMVVVARRGTVGFRRFDRPVLRELLAYSLPLMPANVALWALNLADRIQVQRIAGHEALGAYSVAARVGVPVLILMGA